MVSGRWRLFWAKRSGEGRFREIASRLAALGVGKYHNRAFLSFLSPGGYIAPGVFFKPGDVNLGHNVFLGDDIHVRREPEGGVITLEDRVQIYGDCMFQTGRGGTITIRRETHIQPRCNFSAHVGPIVIGSRVEIAPCCAFYSYNHGVRLEADIMSQPLYSKGGIHIGDGAWLGHGVVVLDGVEVGEGAVVAAGSIVTQSVPSNAIAVGSPARVVRYRT